MLNFKKLVSLLLSFTIVMIISPSVFAKSVNGESEYVPNVIFVDNGVHRQITWDEYNMLINQGKRMKIENKGVIRPQMISYDQYVEKSAREYLDTTQKKYVTPLIDGSEDGASVSYGESQSFTSTFSIDITSSQKNVIISTLGSSYAISASSDKSFGATFNVGPHKQARVVFIPMVRESTGVLEEWVQGEHQLYPKLFSSKDITVIALKKVNSFADGLYKLEYR